MPRPITYYVFKKNTGKPAELLEQTLDRNEAKRLLHEKKAELINEKCEVFVTPRNDGRKKPW